MLVLAMSPKLIHRRSMAKVPGLPEFKIPEGQSLDRIPSTRLCTVLDISRSELYRRYGTPPWIGIGVLIFESQLLDLDEKIDEKISSDEPSRDILRAIIDSCVEVAVEYPGVGPATYGQLTRNDGSELKMPHEVFPSLYQTTLRVIEYGQYHQLDIAQVNPFKLGRNFAAVALTRIARVRDSESAEQFAELGEWALEETVVSQ